jgi:excisionase family DNA binding protein
VSDRESQPRLERRLATVSDAAKYARVSHKTIRRRIDDGTIPALRLGSVIRVDLNDLDTQREPQTGIGTPPARSPELEAHIARQIESWPPLDAEQRDRLAMLLRGGTP